MSQSNPQTQSPNALDRDQIIIRTSITGIVVNILLSGFKAAVGLITHSIAITLDAVNNLSDALSSVITIVGNRLAGKRPDKKHPLGHGRIEYLSAMIVSFIILYAGVTALIESVKKILSPEPADYNAASLIIIAAAIVTKLLLGTYVKKQGRKAHSSALEASGSDALFDAVISTSVLASAVIYLLTGLSLEAYVGMLISAAIIKAGVETVSEPISDILGRRADPDTVREIKRILNEEPEVRGAYDLILNNYGPDKNYASVHLELRDTMTVAEVDELTRRVEQAVYCATGVILTGVGVYSYNTSDHEAAHLRNDIQQRVLSHDWALQLHGFYADMPNKTIRFDVVMSFDIDPKEGLQTLTEELSAAYPDYAIQITPDVDISD